MVTMTARPGRRARGMLLVALLHAALLWWATRPLPHPAPRAQSVWMQLLLPPPGAATAPAPAASVAPAAPPTPVAAKTQRRGVQRQVSASASVVTPAAPAAAPPSPAVPVAAAESAPAPADSPEERALQSPPPASDTRPLPAGTVQQALKAVGAIDRTLRAEHPQQFEAPPDTPRARLIRGLVAAHAAVGPKWFEAARIELISAPNDPKRIYRVTSALSQYCVYFPDKASIAANSDPKSGWASFGQPKMSSCPIPF